MGRTKLGNWNMENSRKRFLTIKARRKPKQAGRNAEKRRAQKRSDW